MPTLTPEQQQAIQSYLARQAGQKVDLAGSVAGSVAAARNPQIRGGGELLKGLGAGLAGAPVDIASAAMRPFGLAPAPEQTVGSSDWFGKLMGADPSSAPFVAGSIGVPDPTDVAKVAAKFDPATISAIMAGIPVFHGSPHKFEAFDLSKIGTGEGVQAYGHGLYYAESPDVAGRYRDALSGYAELNGRKLEGGILKYDSTPEEVAEVLLAPINNEKDFARVYEDSKTFLGGRAQPVIDEWVKSGALKYGNRGHLYHVDIPDEAIEKMLDWDKPLSEQPHILEKITPDAMGLQLREYQGTHAFVNERNRPIGPMFKGTTPEQAKDKWLAWMKRQDLEGSQWYRALGLSHEETSQALNRAGIPGIRYLDQGSRATKEGTRNIVLFDDKLAKITKRE